MLLRVSDRLEAFSASRLLSGRYFEASGRAFMSCRLVSSGAVRSKGIEVSGNVLGMRESSRIGIRLVQAQARNKAAA